MLVTKKATSIVTPIAHSTSTVADPTISVCAATAVRVAGVDGSTTAWYLDGKFWKTVTVDPIAEVLVSGSSPSPCVTDLSTKHGTVDGGTEVMVTGKHLNGTTSATIGGINANISSATDSQLVLTTPAGSEGAAAIVITTGTGTVVAGTFTYIAPPKVTSLSAASGSTEAVSSRLAAAIANLGSGA